MGTVFAGLKGEGGGGEAVGGGEGKTKPGA